MAWNSFEKKSLNNIESKAARVSVGAPIANNPSYAGKGYRDPWDIERAYKEGMQKVVWVSRCIDAIAGNQARLPVILRQNNDPEGKIVTKKNLGNGSILDILNTKANEGENSFIFRYRLSAQLLMSTRGAFIEKIRGRDGRIIGLNLLPPQYTSPIPDPRRFVAGYEVLMPNGEKIIMKPDDVIWIRRPHPIDPYLSMTPMESAGIAIEIENLAKLYNRNYLINDGRPGGLLVLKGEIDEDDKDELRNRFRGNLGRTGATTVIAADDGVDYVDTSSSPRDAAYIQMRQITKEEILASFGVPESVIGNAAGRTFSNAAEEIRVFWIETMMPHLEHLARGLDEADEKHYVDFDTSEVPILVIYKQERERYLLDELQQGLITPNEYREATGRKKVESELADSMLMNPNLTPVGNTEKPMPGPEAQMGGGAPGMPGAMPGAMPGQPGETPAAMPPQQPGAAPLDPNTMQGAMAAEQAPMETTNVEPPEGQLADPAFGNVNTKSDIDADLERWTQILERSLERLVERQQRVVLEKVSGQKARKALAEGTIDPDSVMPLDVWTKQLEEDILPVLNSIMKDGQGFDVKSENNDDMVVHANAALSRIKTVVSDTRTFLDIEINKCMAIPDGELRLKVLRSALTGHFAYLMGKKVNEIATAEARRAWKLAK